MPTTHNTDKQHAFTLLEILLVIVAVGILASIVIIAINPQRQLASFRNGARQNDLRALLNALDQYHIDYPGTYPPGVDGTYQEICLTAGQVNCLDIVDALVPEYIAEIPRDPLAQNASGYFIALHPEQVGKVSLYAAESELISGQEPVVVNEIPWGPQYLSKRLWLDAADADTLTLNGSSISQWRDKSGNSFHANQPTVSLQPQYNTTGLNGTPVVQFLGAATHRMNIPSVGVVRDMVVVYQRSAGTQTVFQYNVDPFNRGFLGHAYPAYTTHNQYAFNGGPVQSVAPTLGVNTPGMYYATNTRVVGNTNSINLGGATTAYTNMNGFVAEFIILSDVLSAQDRSRLEGYLSHKWGLTNNLPDTHLYKESAPIMQP